MPGHGFSEDPADDPGSSVASSKSTGRSLPRNNLPLELSSFVGRGREMEEIEGLLADNRLLTLAGPGGSGKTRLALRVAAEVAGASRTGCGWWNWRRSRIPTSWGRPSPPSSGYARHRGPIS